MSNITVFLFVFGGAGFIIAIVLIIKKAVGPKKFAELERLIFRDYSQTKLKIL